MAVMGYGKASASPLRWSWAVLQLVRRDLKVRYKSSALGVCWSFLNPLMQIVVMTIVFKYILQRPDANFSIRLFTCFLPWLFFSQSLNDGTVCVAKDYLLIKKYTFPRALLPIASIASNLVHLALGFIVLFAIFLVLPVQINRHFLWVIPFLAIQSCLTLGLVLLLGTLQMYYEDIRFLLNSLTQLLFWLCPAVYNIQDVMGSSRLSGLWLTDRWPDLWKELYILLNPLTPLFIGYRAALLDGAQWPALPRPYLFYLGVSAVWAVGFLLLGLAVWRRYQWRFAEVG